MGWGITFKPEVYISHVNKDDVERIYEENEQLIKVVRDEILQLCTATPVFTTAEEFQNFVQNIRNSLEESFETYNDAIRQNVLLRFAKDVNKNEIKEG